MARKIEEPQRPSGKAKQRDWDRYFERREKYAQQQRDEAAGIVPAKKESQRISIKAMAAKFMEEDKCNFLMTVAMIEAAAKYDIKTMYKDAITFQDAGTTVTNWEDDKWFVHYKKRGDSDTLVVKTDGQNSMHAGSNKMWGIGQARAFEAGTTLFKITYNYAASGPQYSMHIYMFIEPTPELKSGDFDGLVLDSGR